MTNTNTNNTTTLAARAAGLLSKEAAYGVAEKAINQAIAARRVYPPMAEDFGQQLGVKFPLKSKDFVKQVSHLLQSTDKPLKGVISKKKSEILTVLSELVSALTGTPPVALPTWALPKERAKTSEAEAKAEACTNGALERANTLAAAEANAAEASEAKCLADAVAMIVARSAELTESQRSMLAAALATVTAEA